MSEVPTQVYNILKTIHDNSVHLDLNINMSLTKQVLRMISNTTSLLIILFTSSQKHLIFTPELYRKLSAVYDEELEVRLGHLVESTMTQMI